MIIVRPLKLDCAYNVRYIQHLGDEWVSLTSANTQSMHSRPPIVPKQAIESATVDRIPYSFLALNWLDITQQASDLRHRHTTQPSAF